MHCASHNEAAGCQHDAAKHVEADPDSPGKLVVHVRNCPEAMNVAHVCGVDSQPHDHDKDQLPESQLELHCAPPFVLCGASAAVTSSRRCVIQYTPPSTSAQSGMKSGILESTRMVYSGRATSPTFSDFG